ncbi:MAG: hypothetical protein LBK28_05945 [Propionibacteriaceae bacterium]|jgi:hypothetical protein|nr:hypothetical protein [Propionibacteriaceae bacterium]
MAPKSPARAAASQKKVKSAITDLIARAAGRLAAYCCGQEEQKGAEAESFEREAAEAINRLRELFESMPELGRKYTLQWYAGKEIRTLIAFFTLADVVGIHGKGEDGKWREELTWRSRLTEGLDSNELKELCQWFQPAKSDDMIKRVLPDLAFDVLDAFDKMRGISVADVATVPVNSFANSIREICAHYDVKPRMSHSVSVLTEAEVATVLGRSAVTVRGMARRGKIVAVAAWTGERVYPAFQFHGQVICPIVTKVLKDIAGPQEHVAGAEAGRPRKKNVGLHGWELALFLHNHLGSSEHLRECPDHYVDDAGTIEELLTGMNLWLPHLRARRTRALDGICSADGGRDAKTTIGKGKLLHRVTETK